jgi:PAS domain S-box-containing protein
MVVGAEAVGGLQVVAGMLALGLLKPAVDNPDTPGSKGYALLTVGTALWMFSLGLSNLTTDYTLITFGYHALVLGTELAAAGWLLLALFATNRTDYIQQTALVVGAGIVFLQLLLWTNTVHHLLYEPGPGVVDGIVRDTDNAIAQTSGWWWIHVAASYLLVGAGEVFLLWERFRSTGIRRKQFTWLSLTFVPLFVASVISTFGLFDLPYNVSSLGFLLALPFLTVGLFRTGFLDIVPVARRTAVAELDAAMVTLDEQERVVDANRRARELFGTGQDYLGTSVGEFFAPVPEDDIARCLDNDGADAELTATVDGQQRHFSCSITPVGERTTQGRVVLLHDITSQKQREQELEELYTRFELALEETDTGIWEWDLDSDELVWDEATERLFGYTAGEFPGTFEEFADRVPDEDMDIVRQELEAAIESGQEYRADFRVQPPDGEQRWVQVRGTITDDDDGEPGRMLGIQTDITEQKEREQAIEQARAELRQIIDLVPDPLYAKTLDDEVLFSNEANAELHGLTPEELEGKREREIESDVENIEDFDKYRQREREVVERGESMTFEERLRGPDGETHSFRITRIPFASADRDEDAVLGYARDVTELKEYEQELEESHQKVEQRNEELETLNRILRHDIRNDVVVMSRLGAELEEHVGDDGEDLLDQLLERGDHIRELTTSLRELMRTLLEEESELKPVRLDTVIESQVRDVSQSFDDAAVTMGDIPRVSVKGNKMLSSVFRNILSNAIRHNDSEVAKVDISAHKRDERVEVRISDNGPGVPESIREDIFGKGKKGLESKGTGIGLYLVNQLVEEYGGEVWVEDRAEHGSAGNRLGADDNEPRGAVFVVELERMWPDTD